MDRSFETSAAPLPIHRILVATVHTASRAAFWEELSRMAPDLAIEGLARPTSLDRKPDLIVWPVGATDTNLQKG